jgi:hypothetical protein
VGVDDLQAAWEFEFSHGCLKQVYSGHVRWGRRSLFARMSLFSPVPKCEGPGGTPRTHKEPLAALFFKSFLLLILSPCRSRF